MTQLYADEQAVLRDLARIREALQEAGQVLGRYRSGGVVHREKNEAGERWDPVTEADLEVDRLLRTILPEEGDGWLSEESVDDPVRLDRGRVWIVDPLDGTREFVHGIPEWCVSIGLVVDGQPVAGGIFNPMTDESIVGAVGVGVTLNDEPASGPKVPGLNGAVVLASRSEVGRGEWERYEGSEFTVRPCGSVAYKLGCVAAGLADATWTLVPKNEWDVAAGAALCAAAGLSVRHADGSTRTFNRRDPLLPNFLAGTDQLIGEFRSRWLN